MSTPKTSSRREWLASMLRLAAGGAILGVIRPGLLPASAPPIAITVYKDPSCGCCTKWVTHLKANGFVPVARDRTDMDALKDSLGVPSSLRSCHTAVSGRYVFEGHVPAADMKKFLAQKPASVVGLAVPGMPMGSPGMETPGKPDRYEVVAFAATGVTKVFARH